jgi:hypothetical protein
MTFTPEFLYLFSFALIIMMKIVCFILSYKIIKLGHQLISSGVKGEFKFSSSFIGFKADLVSISPGLLFVLLGVLLMMIAIYTDKKVSFQRNGEPVKTAADPAATLKDSTITPGVSDFQFEDSSKKK